MPPEPSPRRAADEAVPAATPRPLLRAVGDEERRPGWLEALFPLLNALQGALAGLWSALCVVLAFLAGVLTLRRDLPLAVARKVWAPPLIAMTGSRLEVEPLPEVDWSRPHIFVMNHQSMADIPVAFAALPVNLRFIAKHTLKYVPFIGWYMWFTQMVFVNRSNRYQAVASLAEAGRRIRQGANILAYPEGTRSFDGTILPFKKGPFVLAIEAGVPIIPVAVDGTARLLQRDGFRLRPALVRVKVGSPIETAGLTQKDRDALLRRTRDAIIRMQREIGGLGGDDDAIAEAGVEGKSPRRA